MQKQRKTEESEKDVVIRGNQTNRNAWRSQNSQKSFEEEKKLVNFEVFFTCKIEKCCKEDYKGLQIGGKLTAGRRRGRNRNYKGKKSAIENDKPGEREKNWEKNRWNE